MCADAKTEPANPFVVEHGALLHDIADSKFNNSDETIGMEKAMAFLRNLLVDEAVVSTSGLSDQQCFQIP